MNETLKSFSKPGFACTTLIVGKKATNDGSVIVAHTDDDISDGRVIFVPAADYKPGEKRPVYYDDASLGHEPQYNKTELRRYVGVSRGPGYNTKDYPDSEPLGYIPQVKHTYAYFDSSYGIMNEHQLIMGECTCGAKVHPEQEKDKRIFYSAELSRVALERCKKAKEAVILMGELIRDYGYYGTGETLLVGDPEEAWVMEMCGYDPNGKEGIWVAQRVPDNGFFVAANEFRIREVRKESDDMMYSDNLFKVCEKLGWWNPKEGPLDWLPTVSYGEYSHPYYSLRRVWRALTMAKPSLNLPAWVENGYTKAYPFSVIPDTKLSVADVANIYRDYYQGSEFDLTKGTAAGPWGDPTRYSNNPDQGNEFKLSVYRPKGAWERSISIYRCGMFWINQARKAFPDAIGGISWIGLDRPAASCLMPFFAGIKEMPKPMETMTLTDFKFGGDSAWWAFNFVANYITLKYSYMIEDLKKVQDELEKEAYDAVYKIKPGDKVDITKFCQENTQEVLNAWWKLAADLVVKYNDGCITTVEGTGDKKVEKIMQKVDYPEWWLKQAGYYNGPTSYKKEECYK